MTLRKRISRMAAPLLLAALLVAAGCGVLAVERTSYPTSVSNADGEPYFVEDVDDILNDALLSPEDKAQALRDLGIEDEDLIEALLR
ncbi:MAG: hypothetical protein GY778_30890 [bacterium]|nr:hypothetical protein [bacterium]